MALAVPMLDRSLVRIGNGAYARKNRSFWVAKLGNEPIPPEETKSVCFQPAALA